MKMIVDIEISAQKSFSSIHTSMASSHVGKHLFQTKKQQLISSFLSIFEVVVYYPNDVYTVNTECFYDSIRIRESSSTIFPGLSKKNRARMLSSDCTVPPRAQLMNVLS